MDGVCGCCNTNEIKRKRVSTPQCVCAHSINSLTSTSIQDSNDIQSTLLPITIGSSSSVAVVCCLFVLLAIVWKSRHNAVTSNNGIAQYDVAPVPDNVVTAITGNAYDQIPMRLSNTPDYIEMQMQKPHFANRYGQF